MTSQRSTQFSMSSELVALAGLLLATVLCVQGSTYWNDSGELIISAAFLDIAHPPGAPLYGQVANLFTLIPIGPLAARVHAFNAALLVLLVAQGIWILKHSGWLKTRRTVLLWPILLLTIPAVVRQSLSAEVYLLQSCLLLALFQLYLIFLSTSDKRFLITMSFLAALSIGNHVSGLLAFAPLTLWLLVAHREAMQRAFMPALAAAFIGIAIYGYLPVRALANPPLNTGQAYSLNNFISQVSDSRDRELRPQEDSGGSQQSSKLGTLAHQFAADLARLARDSNYAGASLVIIFCFIVSGLGIAFWRAPKPSAAITIMSVASWTLFAGWDPDPWIPLCVLLSLFAGVSVSYMLERTRLAIFAPLAVATLLLPQLESTIVDAVKMRHYREPERQGRALIAAAGREGVILTEPSWFILSYLKTIEGVQPTTQLILLPAIEHPNFFAPQFIDGERITGFPTLLTHLRSHQATLYEPSPGTSSSLRQISRFHSDGFVFLEPPHEANLETGFENALLTRLSSFEESEGLKYREAIITATAEALDQAQFTEAAARLLTNGCVAHDGRPYCGEIALNNLGIYLTNIGRYDQAIVIFDELLSRTSSRREVFLSNQRRAVNLRNGS